MVTRNGYHKMVTTKWLPENGSNIGYHFVRFLDYNQC